MSTRIVAVTAITSLALVAVAPAVAASSDSDSASAPYIVQFNPGADRSAATANARALGVTVTQEYRHAIEGMAVLANKGQVQALSSNPNVRLVEPDQLAFATDVTQNSATWGIDRTDQRDLPLTTTYTYATVATGVTAYVVDTGILATHAQFGERVLAGKDTIGDGKGTTDCNGHGTHVAGTIGGSDYGMAKQVALVPVRVLNCRGSGTTSQILSGIEWIITDHDANEPAVANMSLGYGAIVTTVDDAVANLVADGVTVAVAAGNSNVDACNDTPARVPTAITVGATTSTDARASFSNYGQCLDLFAPGVNITSAWYAGTTATNTISGTSMASPHVAGAAALRLSGGNADPATVASYITSNASRDRVTGAGPRSPNKLLYVGTALDNVPATPPPTPTATAPAAPTLTSAAPGNKGQAKVTWTRGSDGGSPITAQSVRVYNATTGTYIGSASVSASATSATIRLTRGATYVFGVTATNAIGTSPESNRSGPVKIP